MCDLDGCGISETDKPLPTVTDMQRRAFLKGLAALPLATVLAYPDLARAAAGTTVPTTFDLTSGVTVSGAMAAPAKTPAPALLLVHEWWGLNDQIKSVAVEYAKLGYLTFAIDLYGGKVAKTPAEAKAYMSAMDPAIARQQVAGAVNELRADQRCDGKVGAIGWCFGGGWALKAATLAPVDATVVYYGEVALPASQLAHLKGPVLGHFGTKDQHIDAALVERFETAMHKAKKPFTTYWYDANHAFANPTGARYDAEDAALAWQRTADFLAKYLKG